MDVFVKHVLDEQLRLNFTNAALAIMTNISAGRLSDCLNENKKFVKDEIAAIQDVLLRMDLLVQSLPVPPDFRAARVIKIYFDSQRAAEAAEKDHTRRQILAILREIQLPIRIFVKLQTTTKLDEWQVTDLLAGHSYNQGELSTLLQLAQGIQKINGWLRLEPDEWESSWGRVRDVLVAEAQPPTAGVFNPRDPRVAAAR